MAPWHRSLRTCTAVLSRPCPKRSIDEVSTDLVAERLQSVKATICAGGEEPNPSHGETFELGTAADC